MKREVTPTGRDPVRAAALLAARAALPSAPGDDLARRAFTLVSLNCCGIRSAERRGLLPWLAEVRPDVLCLQEVRAWPDQVPAELRCPPGYNSRWLVSGKKGYSGVATYSRPAPDRHVPGSGSEALRWGDEEARVLRSDFGGLSVFNLYLPSGSSSPDRQLLKFEFLEQLLPLAAGWLAAAEATGGQALLCGDFNIAHTALDIRNAKSNEKNSGFLPAERAWFDRLLAQGWVDVLRALHPGEPDLYSWWSQRGAARKNNVGWRIDYVLASPALAARAEAAWIDTSRPLSDHAPVCVRFRAEGGKSVSPAVRRRRGA
ncbi:MAG: exodeoxyribonuclease III [Planctomycetota bacterium]